MEYEKIKQLIEDMGNSKLSSIDIEFADGTKISMKKEVAQEVVVVNKNVENEVKQQVSISNEVTEKTVVEEEKGNIVKSPMVGTFYAKPSPTSDSYVEIGSTVKVGDTLCIIEAMKLMNEIESEYAGKILEILVKDGDVVEYGTPLFRIG